MKQTPNRKHFGEQVAELIAARGLSLRDVSDAADIPLTTLHRRLKAEHMAFNLGELHRIAVTLGTTAGAIVTDWEAAA
jgi:predicted transcriptional regulator